MAKLEAGPASAKDVEARSRSSSRIELKTAHKKHEKDVEAADRELLARLKKLRGK